MSAAVVLVGCGNMGAALLDGWIDRGLPAPSIHVVEPGADRARAAAERGATIHASAPAAAAVPAEVVLLAVKPQLLEAVAPAYAGHAAAGSTVLSIAAGATLRRLEGLVGAGAAVIRSMPNTPAAVRRGASVLCANAAAREGPHRERSAALLSAVGSVAWVEDEALIDAVTAVSGSGPAYVFLLAEVLASAGVAAGLPEDLAARLARETVAGAGELLARSAEDAATLRRNVTSPGGTTAAALSVLMDEATGLSPLLVRAVQAAAARSRELAG